MLATLVVVLCLLGLLCRGHRAVALENLALRQQLAALTRTRKRSQVRTSDRLFGSASRAHGEVGAPRSSSCTPTPSCGGIANGSAASGHVGQADRARPPLRPPAVIRAEIS
jgi:hypothetical protein